MKPGYSAPYCVAEVVLCRLPWRQFEVGVDDGANELSWWSMFSASVSVRARSRSAWGTKSHRCGGMHRLAVSSPAFRFGPSTCIQPASEHARTVSHHCREGRDHDYNTLYVAHNTTRLPARRRDALSGSLLCPPHCFFCDSIQHNQRGTVQTSVCAALVSLPSDVHQIQPGDWLQPICQSKRRHYQTLHPETLSWGS